jgi:C4-dicarboxylate-specific signal transduction histidine kinase
MSYTDDELRRKSLEFSGRITASLSHEINNVMAIINELAGLLDDFVFAAENGRPIDLERQKTTVRKITGQIYRGREYIQQLNSFAHMMDSKKQDLDLSRCAEQVSFVCQRFARNRKVGLTTQPSADMSNVQGSLFELLHMMFRLVVLAMDVSVPESGISLTVGMENGEICMTVTGDTVLDKDEGFSKENAALEGIVEKLGGELTSSLRPGETIHLNAVLPQDNWPHASE